MRNTIITYFPNYYYDELQLIFFRTAGNQFQCKGPPFRIWMPLVDSRSPHFCLFLSRFE